jgi:hypothetical protein
MDFKFKLPYKAWTLWADIWLQAFISALMSSGFFYNESTHCPGPMTRIMAGWSGSIAAEGTAAAQRSERQLEVERPTSDSEAKLKPSVVYAKSLEEARGWSVSQLQTLQPMSQKHHPTTRGVTYKRP